MASEPEGTPHAIAPDEAFSVLGNETRLGILQALWEAEEPLGFAELRRQVGVADSGGFNYHLDRLSGPFVERTPSGYRLRVAGKQVVRAVVAGGITGDVAFDPVGIDGACPHCGSSLEASYADDTLSIQCTDASCRRGAMPESIAPHAEGALLYIDVPPAAVADRSPDEVAEAATVWFDSKLTAVSRAVCPECAGPVSRTVEVCEGHDPGDGFCSRCDALYGVWAASACRVCRYEVTVPAWVHAVKHPTVIAFFDAHGVAVTPLTWDLFAGETVRPVEEALAAADPLEYRLTFRVDGHELDVDFGPGLEIAGVTARG